MLKKIKKWILKSGVTVTDESNEYNKLLMYGDSVVKVPRGTDTGEYVEKLVKMRGDEVVSEE